MQVLDKLQTKESFISFNRDKEHYCWDLLYTITCIVMEIKGQRTNRSNSRSYSLVLSHAYVL